MLVYKRQLFPTTDHRNNSLLMLKNFFYIGDKPSCGMCYVSKSEDYG